MGVYKGKRSDYMEELKKYAIMMIDPPWPKKKGGLRKSRPNQGRELDYSVMSVEDIFKLLDNDIFPLATDNHTIFLWTIEQFLTETDEEMLKRGYKRHVRMIWDKANGIAPAFTVRYCHEYLVWYYKPKMTKIDVSQRGKFRSVFVEKARQHSRKPEVSYQMLEALYPNETKLDVFSREPRKGWDQFGDQCDYF
tara:strand:+ start:472 stop:1053 length:582 start_codon:yes stop_codon:yes gene_type:complete